MKKILAAIDGLKFSRNTTEYAVQIAQEMHAQLVGVFLDDYTRHSYKIYDLVGQEQGITGSQRDFYDAQDEEARQNSTAFFRTSCLDAGVSYSIHHDRNFAMKELIHESMYADLLLIESKETLTHYEENLPTQFISNLLAQTECPVILVPGLYKPFERVSLLYDGKPSSIFAIKMFSYLFPSMIDKETEIIKLQTTSKPKQNPDNRLMKEFMQRHFPDAKFTILRGQPEIELVNYLKQKNQDQMIVSGAYRRSSVSRWLKPSLADGLMQALGCPLFIAHN
jgi:nucleotide-binding universal stress UspA family protein